MPVPAMLFDPTVVPVPHWYVAPAAAVPPTAVKVTVLPGQETDPDALMEVGAVEEGETVTL